MEAAADSDGEGREPLDVHVRLADAPDRGFVAKLEPRVPPARRARAVAIERVFLAEHAGQPVAYLRFEYLGGRVPFVVALRLTPDARGRGVGHALLLRLEEELRREGHTRLFSSAPEGDAGAGRWHRSEGFVPCGAVEGLFDPEQTEQFYRKRL